MAESGNRFALWQGFHHAWGYNHRLNRLGSYVRHEATPGHPIRPIAGHTAASGTGPDTAEFQTFYTPLPDIPGLGIQSGWVETEVVCPRTVETFFRMRVEDLELDPALRRKDYSVVVLNGFDLHAKDHADKLVTFELEATDPFITPDGDHIRFNLLGSLTLDCRSPECQLFPVRLAVEREYPPARPEPTEFEDLSYEDLIELNEDLEALEEGRFHRLRRRISRERMRRVGRWLRDRFADASDLQEIKRLTMGIDVHRAESTAIQARLMRAMRVQVILKFLRWRISTPYILRVHYLIIAGDRSCFAVQESPYVKHGYAWNLEEEIDPKAGQCECVVPCDSQLLTKEWTCIPAFNRLSMSLTLDQVEEIRNAVQWGQGMHLLEWGMSVGDSIESSPEEGYLTCGLNLWFKNWNRTMKQASRVSAMGSFRAAGAVTSGARLKLLHIKASPVEKKQIQGQIHWPGKGLSASRNPRAISERIV